MYSVAVCSRSSDKHRRRNKRRVRRVRTYAYVRVCVSSWLELVTRQTASSADESKQICLSGYPFSSFPALFVTRVYHWNVNWNGTRGARVIVCRLTNPRIDNEKIKKERKRKKTEGRAPYRVLIVRSNDSYKLRRDLLRSIFLAFLFLCSVLALVP